MTFTLVLCDAQDAEFMFRSLSIGAVTWPGALLMRQHLVTGSREEGEGLAAALTVVTASTTAIVITAIPEKLWNPGNLPESSVPIGDILSIPAIMALTAAADSVQMPDDDSGFVVLHMTRGYEERAGHNQRATLRAHSDLARAQAEHQTEEPPTPPVERTATILPFRKQAPA